MPVSTVLRCQFCGREFKQGVWWTGANYCRAAFLLDYIEDHPGQSAWEISQETGMSYQDTTRGLQKARDWHLVETEAEERSAGGTRYRYTVKSTWREQVALWVEAGYV